MWSEARSVAMGDVVIIWMVRVLFREATTV